MIYIRGSTLSKLTSLYIWTDEKLLINWWQKKILLTDSVVGQVSRKDQIMDWFTWCGYISSARDYIMAAKTFRELLYTYQDNLMDTMKTPAWRPYQNSIVTEKNFLRKKYYSPEDFQTDTHKHTHENDVSSHLWNMEVNHHLPQMLQGSKNWYHSVRCY